MNRGVRARRENERMKENTGPSEVPFTRFVIHRFRHTSTWTTPRRSTKDLRQPSTTFPCSPNHTSPQASSRFRKAQTPIPGQLPRIAPQSPDPAITGYYPPLIASTANFTKSLREVLHRVQRAQNVRNFQSLNQPKSAEISRN